MLNKFKPRYKTNKKIVDWEPTSDSKSRTRDRDKGKAGKGGNFWVKSLADGRTSIVPDEQKHPASKPCDIVVNEDGDTFHLFRQRRSDPNARLSSSDPNSFSIYNTASDFCITKINADGERVWEKIYGFPSYMEDGAGLYMSPDHDGVTPQEWDEVFSYRLPEVFQHINERYKVNSLVYAEGYLYACAHVNTSHAAYGSGFADSDGRTNTELQQIYPDNFVQGIYVVKIDASNGEVVDDSYTHFVMDNFQTSNPLRGLDLAGWAGSDAPIFNYDPYQKKLVILSRIRLLWTTNGSIDFGNTPHRNAWGTAVSEINPDTMQTTIRYLNHQIANYFYPSQAKNSITFSPTHTYVVGRTNQSIHPTRKDYDELWDRLEGWDDTALLKFDKDWNLLDRKQYGYPEKDEEGEYYDFDSNQVEEGYGLAFTQGKSQHQINQIFYSESKDKIYGRNKTSIYFSTEIIAINEYAHGKAFVDNVSGDLDLSFSDQFRITEIEPSDLSVTSVKWPQWNGPEGDNQHPQTPNAAATAAGYSRYNAPTSMSPDGKYIYALVVNQGGFGVGVSGGQMGYQHNQHHYFSAPFNHGSIGGDYTVSCDILRYNIERGEFDRSWCVVGRQWQKTENGYLDENVGAPKNLVATKDGWVASWSDGSGFQTTTAHNMNYSITVGAKDSDLTKREAWIGLTDPSRGGLESTIYEGVMVYQNGDLLSTWEETPGFMTANENWMWDEPSWWSAPFYNEEGETFYTYYNSYQTLNEREEYLDQNTFVHKIADLIGESHKAYDQDGWVDTVFDVQRTDLGDDTYLFTATSYEKPFYRGASEGDIKGGDGGFNDQIELTPTFLSFVDAGYNIDVSNRFSSSALLPPLPETDHHVFYSLKPDLVWSDLPTADPDNGTLELVDRTSSGIVNWDQLGNVDPYILEPPMTYNTQTVYRYRAIFDWDATTQSDWEYGQIVAVERFGLNSVTGQRNQIKTGHRAFASLRPVGKDLMYYHGVPRLLQSEDHKWDMGGPGFRTLDTSNLTDMSYMFYGCPAVPASGPTLSTWDTSNVTDMSFMFWSDNVYDQDMRLTIELGWDTSSVTNMERMLPTQSYVDARTWDFSNVVNINNFASQESLIIVGRDTTVPEIPNWFGTEYQCRDVNSYIRRCWPGLTNYTIIDYEDCPYWAPLMYTVMVTNREITDSDLPMYGSSNVPSDTKLELMDQYETSTRSARYVYRGIFPWNNSNGNDLSWLEDVIQFDYNKLEDGRFAFLNAPITSISAFNNPEFSVSNLTNFDSMFSGCSNFIGGVTGWDTSNVTSMASMFSGCAEFNDDITGWDVSNVQYMDSMFSGCSNFNQDISVWATASLIGADSQFNQASSFNQDLSEWCVRGLASEPTDFSTGASSWTLPKPVWGTCPRNEDALAPEYYHIFVANSNLIRFPVMRNDAVQAIFVDDVPKEFDEVQFKSLPGSTIKAVFDWENDNGSRLDWVDEILQIGYNSVTDSFNQLKSGKYAFYDADISDSDVIANLDVSNLTDCSRMFYLNQSTGTLDLSGWDTSNFTNMTYFFASTTCNFVGIENWNVSNVTNMSALANSATQFNADISGWDVSNNTNLDTAFISTPFNQDISGWDTSGVTAMGSTFRDTPFNQDISGWDTSSVTSMYGMFQDTPSFNADISGWDTSGVTDMRYMFQNATSFNQDLFLWCVENISSYPANFDAGATSWVLTRPVWGTCPAPATTFVTNTPTLTWDMLPTNDADNGSINLLSDNGDGTWTFEVDAFYDNSVVQKNLSWIVDVLDIKWDVFNNQAYAFNGSPATSITVLNKDNIASAIGGADLSYMFANMPNFNQNISGWDVSATTNMNSMFSGAASFNQDLSPWNTVSVTSMEDMFNGATSFNQDLSAWCVGLIASEPSGFATGATSWTLDQPVWGTCPRNEDGLAPDEFYHIFVANGYPINLPVSDDKIGLCFVDGFEVDYVVELKNRVRNGKTIKVSFDWDNENENGSYRSSLNWIQDLVQIGFNTETMSYNQIKNGKYAFYGMEYVVESDVIANLDISNLTNFDSMFAYCEDFNTDINGWDVSNITSMDSTFRNCWDFNKDISGWDVSNVTSMNRTFGDCLRFDQPIGSWNVSNVTDMNYMFYNAYDFNQDISGWDTSNVADMYGMFFRANGFDQDISSWDVSKVTEMAYMFRDAASFNQDLSGWCVGSITSKPIQFDTNASAWTEPRPVWGTCPRLVTKFISNTNVLNWSMLPTNDPDDGSLLMTNDNGDGTYSYEANFLYDNSVVQKNLSWLLDVIFVKDNSLVPSYAFNGSPATSITALESDYVSVEAVEDLSYMFANMPNFNQDISGWSTTAATNMSYMFSGAASFDSDISGWDTEATTSMEGMFSGAASFNQNLSKWCVGLIATEPADFDTGATAWLEENKPVWGVCPQPTQASRVREAGDLVGPNDRYASTSDAQSDGWTIEGATGDDNYGSMTVPANIQGVKFFGIAMLSVLYNGTNGFLTLPDGQDWGADGDFVSESAGYDFWLSHWNQDTYTLAQMHKVVNDEWVIRSEYQIPYNGVFGCVVETTFKPDGSVKVVYGTVVSSSTIDIGTNKQGFASDGVAIVEGFGDAANSLGDFVWEYNMP